jgi:hypothetical protein
MITKKDIDKIMEFCYENNTIPMKDLFKDMPNSKLSLAVTDGGWVNVINLKNFLESMEKK